MHVFTPSDTFAKTALSSSRMPLAFLKHPIILIFLVALCLCIHYHSNPSIYGGNLYLLCQTVVCSIVFENTLEYYMANIQ